LLTETERALDAFARLAHAMARNEAVRPGSRSFLNWVGNWAEKKAGRCPSPLEFEEAVSAGPEETENLISAACDS